MRKVLEMSNETLDLRGNRGSGGSGAGGGLGGVVRVESDLHERSNYFLTK